MTSLVAQLRRDNLALVRASDGCYRRVHRATGVTVGGDVSAARALAAMRDLEPSVTPHALDLRSYGVTVWIPR